MTKVMQTAPAAISSKNLAKMPKAVQDQIIRAAAKAPEAPAPEVKSEEVKAPAAPAKQPKPKPPYLLFLTALIEEGKFTQKELSAAAIKAYPEVAKSTIETVLVDSKNIKYNRFPKLVVKDDKGLLSFAKAS